MSFERRKVRIGRVVSDKMDRTVVVLVEWRRPHPLYRKPVRRGSRFKAHDENNMGRVGDLVRIMESRPLSKTKRWRLVEILAHEEIAEIQPEDIDVEAVEEKSVPKAGARKKVAEPVVEEEAPTEAEEEKPKPKAGARQKVAEPVVEEDSVAEPEETQPSAGELDGSEDDKQEDEEKGGGK